MIKIISENSFEKARKLIRAAEKPVIFTSNDDELNRKIMEKEKIDVLLVNLKARKDWQKQKNSGFDPVMAREAGKKKIMIAINLSEIIQSSGREKAEIMGRIRQNVMLCRKYGVKMTFLPKSRDEYGLRALGSVLGMPTWMFSFK